MMTKDKPFSESFDRLSLRNFQALAEIIERRVGIKMPPAKQTMVEGRLRKRLRALDLACLDDYARHVLEPGRLDQELPYLIDCVTTNKTDFFREPSHFEFLRDHAAPSLLEARGKRRADLKIWSAACSTGAEAYTIAMVLQDRLESQRDFRYSILGTDISNEVLEEARAGIYPTDFVATVPADFRRRFLMPARDLERRVVRIAPELRARARFERLNLMDPAYPFDEDIDVIFCRNVLIYFDKPTQQAVVARLASHLRAGGFLILGHSESMAGTGVPGISQVVPTVFTARPLNSGRSAT